MDDLPPRYTEGLRQRHVAASCWVDIPHESAAMWRLYCSGNEGVAIRTTFGKLRAVVRRWTTFEPNVVADAARVRYLDHAKDSILRDLKTSDPLPNLALPSMLKHVSYKHEHEVRALVFAPQHVVEPQGCGIPIDVADFVDQVVVNPHAEPWFEETVREFSERYQISSVQRSALDRRVFWDHVTAIPQGGQLPLPEPGAEG